MSAGQKDNVMSELREITECCICSETFTDARMLPCIHTFCLRCLQQAGSQTNKKPGDQMPCPVCRSEFTIPTKGWTYLQKNFFMQRLIEMTKAPKSLDDVRKISCDICKSESEDAAVEIPSATTYCVECRDNMCERCTGEHKRNKASRNHEIVPVGTEITEEIRDAEDKSSSGFCTNHPSKQLDVYCFDCKTVICVSCFFDDHQSHRCSDVSKVVDDLKKQMSRDVDRVSEYSVDGLKRKELLEEEKMNFIEKMERVETDVRRRNEELKQMLDKHTKSLLEELLEMKEKRLKEMENEKEEMDRHLAMIDSLKRYCDELKSKGSPVDICRTVNDLHLRADELKQQHESYFQRERPLSYEIRFETTDSESTDLQIFQMFGKIIEVGGKIAEDPVVAPEKDGRTSEVGLDEVTELFWKSWPTGAGKQSTFDSNEQKTTSQITREMEAKFTKFANWKSLLTGDVKQSTFDSNEQKTTSQITREMEDAAVGYSDNPVLVHTIETNAVKNDCNKCIWGMAFLNDELFIVHSNSPDVEVYDRSSFVFQRAFSVDELESPIDMKSCVSFNCLYISDERNDDSDPSTIFKINREGILLHKWFTGKGWETLSVSYDSNVVVASEDVSSLKEYTPQGRLIRQLNLGYIGSQVDGLHYALKIGVNIFLVCYSDENGEWVCTVDVDERRVVMKLKDCSQCSINDPQYLAVDRNGNILVVDENNRRVMLLNSNLQFQKELVSSRKFRSIRYPIRITLDELYGRLFLSDAWLSKKDKTFSKGHVVVFNIK